LKTLGGATLEPAFAEGRVTINGAKVLATDLQASNGIVHLIDTVLIPEGFALEPIPDELRIYAEALELHALAVDRGVPIFNAGDHEASAAIYEIAAQSMLRLGAGPMDEELIEKLRKDCAEAAQTTSARDRAWDYRRVDIWDIEVLLYYNCLMAKLM
ncbi:MAG: fasciclin domain-containing protein, partial [Chloroflexota bacterium]